MYNIVLNLTDEEAKAIYDHYHGNAMNITAGIEHGKSIHEKIGRAIDDALEGIVTSDYCIHKLYNHFVNRKVV